MEAKNITLQVQSAETGGSEGSQTSLCPQGGTLQQHTHLAVPWQLLHLHLRSYSPAPICTARRARQLPYPFYRHRQELSTHRIPDIQKLIIHICASALLYPTAYYSKKPKTKTNQPKKPAYPHTLASSSPIYTPDTSLTPASALIFL